MAQAANEEEEEKKKKVDGRILTKLAVSKLYKITSLLLFVEVCI